jgi:hypothetical protein
LNEVLSFGFHTSSVDLQCMHCIHFFFLVLLLYSSAPKMKAVHSSETSVHQTARRQISKDGVFQIGCFPPRSIFLQIRACITFVINGSHFRDIASNPAGRQVLPVGCGPPVEKHCCNGLTHVSILLPLSWNITLKVDLG